jgi:TatD DNase family protein
VELIDTHCHIHEILERLTPVHDKWIKGGVTDVQTVLEEGRAAGVTKAICVGTSYADSELAVRFVQNQESLWASIGIHPHEAKVHLENQEALEAFAALAAKPKVVAIGECGLDYFYEHSPRTAQIELLKFQLQLATKHTLPLIFHVREAFDDFWPIFDSFSSLTGVIHSFSAGKRELEAILERGLYVGLNGIMTFTKEERQLEAARLVPLEKMLLETDAPFLTPAPYRGKICQLKHVQVTAAFLAHLRGEPLEDLSRQTTANAQQLFNLV